ncbi:MAG TPA: hypothetical protein PK743_11255, partial [Luteimonas sp.]|nr:hypothetical protein [Luteimonas sp.]
IPIPAFPLKGKEKELRALPFKGVKRSACEPEARATMNATRAARGWTGWVGMVWLLPVPIAAP